MTLPNRTFGIEIELIGLNVSRATQVLLDAGVEARDCGYTHNVTSYWKVVTDSSIGYDNSEIVSPVLSGVEGLEQIRKVCRALNNAGATVNRSCGLHVHVGTNNLTAMDVANIVSRYAHFETEIDSWMPRSRRENVNTFCNSIRTYLNRIDGSNFTTIDNVRVAFGGNRYVKVNLESYTRHRTIEFRQHSGTVNGSKIVKWITFLLHFIEASRYVPPAITAVENSNNNSVNRTRVNSIDTKFDNVIRAFRATPRLSIQQIAEIGGWSTTSVAPYISRMRTERGCQFRASRSTGGYVLIGNTGRLSNEPANNQTNTTTTNSAVTTVTATSTYSTVERAARHLVIRHDSNDNVFRGIPDNIVSFYKERAEELGNMNT